MVKNILVIADLGAAGNLVKNLLWLSPDVDWPLVKDRYTSVLNQYSPGTKFSEWLEKEAKFRLWKYHYGIDLSYDLNYDEFVKSFKQKNLPAVFLNHSAFYQQEQLTKFLNNFTVLYVRPTTDFGFEWQIRSYCEKKNVEDLHNFSFDIDIEENKKKYIADHGLDQYYRFNLNNMRHMLRSRQEKMNLLVKNTIPLEDLLFASAKRIADYLPVAVDTDILNHTVQSWRNLHWPLDSTLDWKYSYDRNS